MSSTFAELFSDFQDLAKAYTERLDITELSFMRLYTHGIQEFQRETNYVEKTVELTRQVAPLAPIIIAPDDMLYPIDIRSLTETPCGIQEEIFLFQQYTQFIRNKDKWGNDFLETPTDYEMRIHNKRTAPSKRDGHVRLCTIWQREFITFPEFTGDKIVMWYIPDLHAISQSSSQWTSWFPIDTNFMPNFTTMSIYPTLAPFEIAFLDYALASYIKSKGSANYKVYEQSFKEQVQRAIETKPTMYREGVSSYMFAPYS